MLTENPGYQVHTTFRDKFLSQKFGKCIAADCVGLMDTTFRFSLMPDAGSDTETGDVTLLAASLYCLSQKFTYVCKSNLEPKFNSSGLLLVLLVNAAYAGSERTLDAVRIVIRASFAESFIVSY